MEEKIRLHQKETYSKIEKANLHKESLKYDILEALKKEIIAGHFTTEKEII